MPRTPSQRAALTSLAIKPHLQQFSDTCLLKTPLQPATAIGRSAVIGERRAGLRTSYTPAAIHQE